MVVVVKGRRFERTWGRRGVRSLELGGKILGGMRMREEIMGYLCEGGYRKKD